MFTAAVRRYRAAYAGLPRDVWLLAIVLFVNRCGTMVLPFMTLYLTSELGMSDAAAGRMISVYGLGAVCGAYLGGRLSEAIGPIRVQTVCMFLTVPGFLLLPTLDSWLTVAVTLFCLSVAAESVRPANATAIARLTTPENRTRAYALNRLAINLGFSFGPAIGGVLATIDFGLLFLVDALTTAAAAATLGYFFRGRLREGMVHVDEAPRPRVAPLGDRTFVWFLLLMLANAIVFFQFSSTYPLYLRDHFGLDTPLIGLMFAVNTTVIVACEMLLIDAIKHWPLVRTIGWGCFLSCLGFGMLPFGASGAYCVLAMLVLTIGEMLSFSLSAGFVANRSPRGGEGRYMGWYAMVFAAASVLGPAIGSAIYQVNPDAVWLAGLGVGVVVLAGFHLLHTRESEEEEVGDVPVEVDAPPASYAAVAS